MYSYCIVFWEILVRKNPYFDLRLNHIQIMFGVFKGSLRPKNIKNCPRIFELLLSQGMNGDPNKRPTMEFIFKLMTHLDSSINKKPIRPIVKYMQQTSISSPTKSTLGSMYYFFLIINFKLYYPFTLIIIFIL